jgi:hypothetical protein
MTIVRSASIRATPIAAPAPLGVGLASVAAGRPRSHAPSDATSTTADAKSLLDTEVVLRTDANIFVKDGSVAVYCGEESGPRYDKVTFTLVR